MTVKMKMSSDSLPKEIVYDILTRLPVKSLCRFKCVSKSWLSTISTSEFVDSHFYRSRSDPRLLISIWTTASFEDHRQSLFIADGEETEQEKKGPLVLGHQVTLRVKQVPNHSLSIDSRDEIVITNPITKSSVAFPRSFPKKDRLHRSVCFGFDSLGNKHKIVESEADSSVGRMEHRVVSLSDFSNWRSVEVPANSYYSVEEVVCVDGVIYYAAWGKPTRTMQEPWIVAFDLRSEKFQVAKLSIKGRLSIPVIPYRFIELEGKLAIVDYPYSNKVIVDYPYSNKVGDDVYEVPALDLWVMEDFENQVWSFKSCRLTPSFTRTRQLIGTTIDGELIFVEFGNKDNPFILTNELLPVYLPEEDMPFSFYFFNIKTGLFRSREVRLPLGYPLTDAVTISAASLVERL